MYCRYHLHVYPYRLWLYSDSDEEESTAERSAKPAANVATNGRMGGAGPAASPGAPGGKDCWPHWWPQDSMWPTYKVSDTRLIFVTRQQGPISLRLMTSQFKDIVTLLQKQKTVKCIFCGVWVQNFMWNFKGALWNFTQNFEPIHCKICILRGVKNLTTYDILELWHLKS